MRNPDELTDQELDLLLARWDAPEPSAAMRDALALDAPRPWYRNTIRVPVPAALAAALLVLAILAAARWARPSPAPLGFHELRPVAVLEPRIVRGDQ